MIARKNPARVIGYMYFSYRMHALLHVYIVFYRMIVQNIALIVSIFKWWLRLVDRPQNDSN